MYYNGNKYYKVTDFLNIVHDIMYNQYGQINQEEKINAQELQNFFQEFKKNLLSDNPIDNKVNQIILDTMISQYSLTELRSMFTTKGSKGGFLFEQGLALIISSVLQNVSNDDIQMSKIIIGQTTAGIDIFNWSDKLTQKILKSLGTKTEKYFIKEDKKNKKKLRYLQDVDGKVDVQGYTVNVNYGVNIDLLKIYNLLKDATFTAKNYTQDYLEIGNTNLYRSIVGVLQQLGYNQKVSESALYAGLNLIKKKNVNVSSHFYHLRFLYELTGFGLKYDGQKIGTAKYLIFNQPDGNIYVKSTSELIAEVIQKEYNANRALAGISIPASKFF